MVYLTMVRILANVEADSPADAARILNAALEAAGFQTFPEGAEPDDVIVSEETEPSGFPSR